MLCRQRGSASPAGVTSAGAKRDNARPSLARARRPRERCSAAEVAASDRHPNWPRNLPSKRSQRGGAALKIHNLAGFRWDLTV
jgi:hypothetical protein